MIRRSQDHLAEAGETYVGHLAFAGTVGLLAIAAGLACLVHALVPALCTRTCSTIIARLQTLFADRDTLPLVAEQSSGAMAFVGLVLLASLVAMAPLVGGAPFLLGLVVGALAFAIPLTFLLTNPELDSVGDPA